MIYFGKDKHLLKSTKSHGLNNDPELMREEARVS